MARKPKLPPHKAIRTLVGENLGDIMGALGVDNEELARRTGIDVTTIRRIRRGAHGVTLDYLGCIADKLHLHGYARLFADRPALTGEGEQRFRAAPLQTAQRNITVKVGKIKKT